MIALRSCVVSCFAVSILWSGLANGEIQWSYVKPGPAGKEGQWLEAIVGAPDFGYSYGIIVGLSRFENFNRLDTTENDPQRIFDFLRDDIGFDFLLLMQDEEVTYTKLRTLFEYELPKILETNDRLLFFLVGSWHPIP